MQQGVITGGRVTLAGKDKVAIAAVDHLLTTGNGAKTVIGDPQAKAGNAQSTAGLRHRTDVSFGEQAKPGYHQEKQNGQNYEVSADGVRFIWRQPCLVGLAIGLVGELG